MSNYEITKKKKTTSIYQDITQNPQHHISIDLIGPYKTTSQGNAYTLSAVCNLTGYLMTTPYQTKGQQQKLYIYFQK